MLVRASGFSSARRAEAIFFGHNPLAGIVVLFCSWLEQLVILEFVAQGFQVRKFVAVALGDCVIQGLFAGPFDDGFHLVECGDEPLSFVKVEYLRKVCLRGVYFGVSHFQVSCYPVTLDRGSIVFVCADAVKCFLVGKRNYFCCRFLVYCRLFNSPPLASSFFGWYPDSWRCSPCFAI